MLFFGWFAIIAGVLASLVVTGWWLYSRKKKFSQLTSVSVPLCIVLTLAGAGFQSGDLGLLITSALVFCFSTWVLSIAILSECDEPIVKKRQGLIWIQVAAQIGWLVLSVALLPDYYVPALNHPIFRIIFVVLCFWQGIGMIWYFMPWKLEQKWLSITSMFVYFLAFVLPVILAMLLGPVLASQPLLISSL
ncbi:MAG: hypothetical protein R3F51_12020 [Cyanobacteriota/Melainabacteria group bacterium]